MNALHPKQMEHRHKAEVRRAKQNVERNAAAALTSTHKLRFVHVRREQDGWDVPFIRSKGGVTVAYQLPARRGDRLIKVACSLVHHNDAYCKRTGRFYAAMKFDGGHWIEVRVPKNMPTSMFIKHMFGTML